MDFDIREFVNNGFDPEMEQLYDTINHLINRAGDLTIADLFLKGRSEMGEDAWSAVQSAKQIGFFAIDEKNELIDMAEYITIADLFLKSRSEMDKDEWSVVQNAKQAGFLSQNNKQCCQGYKCRSSDGGWCNMSPKGGCSVASDSCDSLLTRLLDGLLQQ